MIRWQLEDLVPMGENGATGYVGDYYHSMCMLFAGRPWGKEAIANDEVYTMFTADTKTGTSYTGQHSFKG